MVIITNKPGQLANRLFIFSTFLANAIEYGYSIVNPAFDEFAKFFPEINQDLFCRYPFKKTWIKSTLLRKLLYQTAYYFARFLHRLPFHIPGCAVIYLDWDQSIDLNDPSFLTKAKKNPFCSGMVVQRY